MKLKSYVLAATTLTMIASPFAALADDAKPAAAAPAAAAPAAAAPAAAPGPQADPELVQKWAKFCGPAPDGHNICLVRKILIADGHIAGTLTLQLDTAKGAPQQKPVDPLLNGPQLSGRGASQAEIDQLFDKANNQ